MENTLSLPRRIDSGLIVKGQVHRDAGTGKFICGMPVQDGRKVSDQAVRIQRLPQCTDCYRGRA